MIDAKAVPVAKIYEARLYADSDSDFEPLDLILRTKNDKKNELGIPCLLATCMVFEQAGSGAAASTCSPAKPRCAILPSTGNRTPPHGRPGHPGPPGQRKRRHHPHPPRPPLDPRRARVGPPVSAVNRIELGDAAYLVQAEVRIDLDDGQEIARSDVVRRQEEMASRSSRSLSRPDDTLNIRYQTVQSN